MQQQDVVLPAPVHEVDVVPPHVVRDKYVAPVGGEGHPDPLGAEAGVSLGALQQPGEAPPQPQLLLHGQLLPYGQAIATTGGLGLHTTCTGVTVPLLTCHTGHYSLQWKVYSGQ